jgi:hypothetical protein
MEMDVDEHMIWSQTVALVDACELFDELIVCLRPAQSNP